MSSALEKSYNPLDTYFPKTAAAVRDLAGHVVFEGMAQQWAKNPDFTLVEDVKGQIDWLVSEGHGVVPSELISNLSAGDHVV